jgi:hypothetical protein
MILLSACEPDDPRAESGIGPGNEKRGNIAFSTPGNNASRIGIAVRESVGKPPPARDMTAAIRDTCPLHHGKMRARIVPIIFDGSSPEGAPAANAKASAEFPFGIEEIVASGSALLPDAPVSARVYVCDTCLATKRAADKNRETASVPVASQ